MKRTAAFLTALADTITADLRDQVDGDKLQGEVENELQRQVLAQLVTSIGEYQQASQYFKTDKIRIKITRNKCLRFMGYCEDMWSSQDEVKGVLVAGAPAGLAD